MNSVNKDIKNIEVCREVVREDSLFAYFRCSFKLNVIHVNVDKSKKYDKMNKN